MEEADGVTQGWVTFLVRKEEAEEEHSGGRAFTGDAKRLPLASKEGQSHDREIGKAKVIRSPWQIMTGLFSWQITLPAAARQPRAAGTWARGLRPKHIRRDGQRRIFNRSIFSHTGNHYSFTDIYCFQHWNYGCKTAHFNDSPVL